MSRGAPRGISCHPLASAGTLSLILSLSDLANQHNSYQGTLGDPPTRARTQVVELAGWLASNAKLVMDLGERLRLQKELRKAALPAEELPQLTKAGLPSPASLQAGPDGRQAVQ